MQLTGKTANLFWIFFFASLTICPDEEQGTALKFPAAIGEASVSVLKNRSVTRSLLRSPPGSRKAGENTLADRFILGADVSFIPQIEDLGGEYKENGVPKDALKIFKNFGMNWLRLKLWHSPERPYNDLPRVLEMARRLRDENFSFLLDFHYSDTWADPGKQHKPAAWNGLSFETLKDSVYQYTRKVLRALADQNTLPDMVQIGNEITPGFLWNDGRVGGQFDTVPQWRNLADLINSAIRGIRDSSANGDSVDIMIHIDRGGDNAGSRWFLDNLTGQGVNFDVIGLSFYPWWHGTMQDVRANLNDLAVRYDKDILIAETAYPWTLQWFDATNNIVGSADGLPEDYPASVEGQAGFLRDLIQIIRYTKNHRGIGLLYWAPEYISVDPIGSPWENNALFDFEGNALESMKVFSERPSTSGSVQVTIRLNTATLQDTFRADHIAQLRGSLNGNPELPDGKRITWDASSEVFLENRGGDYWETTLPMNPGDRLSFKFWTGFSTTTGTFQRLGWEGPVTPAGSPTGNERVFVAGEQDTLLPLQYYNSSGSTKTQYWRPFENKADSVSVYFRVNMGEAARARADRFDPAGDSIVAVRGDGPASGGRLDWNVSRFFLIREESSVDNGSFWSGVCRLSKKDIEAGNRLEYQFYIENNGSTGSEDLETNRYFLFTPSLIARGDTTLHWAYFGESVKAGAKKKMSNLPEAFHLFQNHPNPFNSQTDIEYMLNRPSTVNLQIYDIHGKILSSRIYNNQPAGCYSVTWDGLDKNGNSLPSGFYLIKLVTGYGSGVRRSLLLK